MSKKNIWVIILAAIAAIFIFRECKNNNDLSNHEQIQLIEALQDSVRYLQDAKGDTITTIKTIEVPRKVFVKIDTQNDSLLQIIKSLNEEIIRLEDAVVLVNETRFKKDSIKTVTVIEYRDTSKNEITKKTVKADYYDEWVEVDVELNVLEESLSLDFSMVNTLEIWHERQKGKLFKPGTLEVFVRNENPYVRTPKLRSYKVQDKKARRFGFGVFAGYGWSNDIVPDPVIGAGLMYRIF